ncbi:MAG: cytochrome C oxidase subunit IV family protein [Bacteroidota bacterium]
MAHAAHGHDEHAGHGGHHVIAKRDLTRTISILVFLTALTVVLGLLERYFAVNHEIEIFGPFSVPIALLIASVKAYFVAAYFMGLKHDGGTNLLAFAGSVVFLVIFLSFTYLDTGFRDTFEERSAVPVDELQRQDLEAAAETERLQPSFDAVPLVNDPDTGLFPAASTAEDAMDDAASATDGQEATAADDTPTEN